MEENWRGQDTVPINPTSTASASEKWHEEPPPTYYGGNVNGPQYGVPAVPHGAPAIQTGSPPPSSFYGALNYPPTTRLNEVNDYNNVLPTGPAVQGEECHPAITEHHPAEEDPRWSGMRRYGCIFACFSCFVVITVVSVILVWIPMQRDQPEMYPLANDFVGDYKQVRVTAAGILTGIFAVGIVITCIPIIHAFSVIGRPTGSANEHRPLTWRHALANKKFSVVHVTAIALGSVAFIGTFQAGIMNVLALSLYSASSSVVATAFFALLAAGMGLLLVVVTSVGCVNDPFRKGNKLCAQGFSILNIMVVFALVSNLLSVLMFFYGDYDKIFNFIEDDEHREYVRNMWIARTAAIISGGTMLLIVIGYSIIGLDYIYPYNPKYSPSAVYKFKDYVVFLSISTLVVIIVGSLCCGVLMMVTGYFLYVYTDDATVNKISSAAMTFFVGILNLATSASAIIVLIIGFNTIPVREHVIHTFCAQNRNQ